MQANGFLQALHPSFQIEEGLEKFTRCDLPNRNVTASDCLRQRVRNIEALRITRTRASDRILCLENECESR